MIVVQQEERGYTVFLNDDFKGKQLAMLEFGFSRIGEKTVIGPRIRKDYLLHFVLQGTGKFDNTPVCAGEGFLICPGKLHSFSIDPETVWEHCWVAFSGFNAESVLKQYGIPAVNHTFSFSCLEQFRLDVERMRRLENPTELNIAAFFWHMLMFRGLSLNAVSFIFNLEISNPKL